MKSNKILATSTAIFVIKFLPLMLNIIFTPHVEYHLDPRQTHICSHANKAITMIHVLFISDNE